MLLKDNKKGLVTIIMKKMRGHDNNMSPEFKSSEERMEKPKDAEQDYEHGYDSCCNDMIEAFKSGDSQKLKSSLKSFISMMMDEEDKHEDY